MERKDSGVALVGAAGVTTGEGWTIYGYGAYFDNLDQVGDIIRPGAFIESLKARPSVPLLWSHDITQPIGKVLVMSEDNNGLAFKAVISKTSLGADIRQLVADQAVRGVSIGYDAVGKSYHPDFRELSEIALYELSLCVFPANEEARVTAMAMLPAIQDAILIAEAEALMERGLTPSVAAAKSYMAAVERTMERSQYDGKTAAQAMREAYYSAAYDVQELERLR